MIYTIISATVAIMFGSATVAYACFVVALGIRPNADEMSELATSNGSSDGSSLDILHTLSTISKLGVVLALISLSNRWCVLPNDSAGQDLDFILFAIGSIFAAAFATSRQNQTRNDDETEEVLLPRAQTDEWKGAMQTLLLIGSIYDGRKSAGHVSLLFAAAFLWLTGFCHASYYLNNCDYGLQRVTVVLLRMNVLAILVSLASGVPSDILAYPACGIHSLAYVLVYSVMAISGRGCNQRQNLRKILLTVFGTLALSSIIFSSLLPCLFLPTLFGVLFALNRAEIMRQLRVLENGSALQVVGKKSSVLIMLVCVSAIFLIGKRAITGGKLDPRPLYVICPPVAYVLLRNLNPSFRKHNSALFRAAGSVSLELYVLRRHLFGTCIWSAPYEKVAILSSAFLCYYAAQISKTATNTMVSAWFLLPNSGDFLRQVVYQTALAFALCLVFSVMRFPSSISTPIVSVVFGLTIFQRSLKSSHHSSSSRALYAYVVCFAVTLFAGVSFQLLLPAQNDISLRTNRVDKTCEKAVLDGSWVHVNTCVELDSTPRNDAIASYGTCDSLQWAWNTSPSESYCPFTHRKPEKLLQDLRGRQIVFIGDSEIRHLFYAVCRCLGDSSAGAYNTTMEKHSNVLREYNGVSMDFRWAPFVQNISSVLDEEILEDLPDAIVIGGGAWDRLHHFEHRVNREVLLSAVASLAKDIRALRETLSIVWVTPTTINSWALNTEEKRRNIREEQMQAFRELYQEAGINSAASFLFDGTSYTKDRVDECYDGVHYPFSVYDGGAQILANAFDWLLPVIEETNQPVAKHLSPWLYPALDSAEYFPLIIAFCSGLFAFDNFLFTFYVASVVWPELRPWQLRAQVRAGGM